MSIRIALLVACAPLAHAWSARASARGARPRGAVRMAAPGVPPPPASYGKAAPVLTDASLRRTTELALATDGEGDWRRKISLIGSTGSIGTQTLDIVRARPDRFEVTALAAGRQVEQLAEQVAEFQETVKVASIGDASLVPALKDALAARGVSGVECVGGADGPTAAATQPDADVVVTGIVGCAGLLPTVEAIKAGKDIALANKETLIAGGPAILPLLEKHGVTMTPADSEHSAIFQALQGVPPGGMRRVILTASGGAFRDYETDELLRLCKEDPEFVRQKATTHPNWDMGAKITVDSATMMNKGLEVIEAHYLFGAAYDDIDIVIHPQSIIHSAIETLDCSMIAQMGWPDMRLPILYSIAWPHRVAMPPDNWEKPLDLIKLGSMTFKGPDNVKYPCIELAYSAGRQGGTMTGVLNAANEMANELFREGKASIGFMDIPRVIEATMEAHKDDFKAEPSLQDILDVDEWARKNVLDLANSVSA